MKKSKNLFFSLVLLAVLSLTIISISFVSANWFSDLFGSPTGKVTSGICGNGIIEAGELCDGEDVLGSIDSCDDFGFASGSLICSSSCTFDTSKCVAKTKPTNTCTDSDDGKNYDVYGYVNANGLSYGDYCLVAGGNFNYVNEYYCDINNNPATSTYNCSNGCSNGACLKNNNTNPLCSDIDLKAVGVDSISNGVYSITLRRDAGGGAIGGVKIILYNDTTNSRVLDFGKSILELETITQNITSGIINANKMEYTVYLGSPGNETICPQTSIFVFGSYQFCTDSDGGKDYYVKGAQWDSVSNFTFIDSCVIDQAPTGGAGYLSVPKCEGANCFVTENFCSSKLDSPEFYNCPNGCSDGACVNSITKPVCKEGDSNSMEIQEGSIGNVLGLNIRVISADETNLKLSATIKIEDEGEFFDLSSDSLPAVYPFYNGQQYAIDLVSTSDTSATIKVTTCGIKTPKTPTCKDSDGGKEIYVKGDLYGLDIYGNKFAPSDVCVDSSGMVVNSGSDLIEMYCNMDVYEASERITCPNGCSDGACIKRTPVICRWFKFLPFCKEDIENKPSINETPTNGTNKTNNTAIGQTTLGRGLT